MGLCDKIKTDGNKKCIELYKRMLYHIRWADPVMPMALQNLINDYVAHLLGPADAYGRRKPFRGEGVLRGKSSLTHFQMDISLYCWYLISYSVVH